MDPRYQPAGVTTKVCHARHSSSGIHLQKKWKVRSEKEVIPADGGDSFPLWQRGMKGDFLIEGMREKNPIGKKKARSQYWEVINIQAQRPVLTSHFSPLTSHFSLLTPYSSLLTPYSLLLTPYSLLLTPHSLLLTPHFSLLTPDVFSGWIPATNRRGWQKIRSLVGIMVCFWLRPHAQWYLHSPSTGI